MIDSIHIALTGLRGFERGLKNIANNAANLNTPGFKSSTLQFGDLFSVGGAGGIGAGAAGQGVATLGTLFSFEQGQLQGTNNPLDLALDGVGFFVLRDAHGNYRYTRDGQFEFNADGILVTTKTEEEVMGRDANGALTAVSIAALRTSAPAPTANITFNGNLSSAQNATTHTINSVTVYDQSGASHTVSIRFDKVEDEPGHWTITVLEGTEPVDTAEIVFQERYPTTTDVPITFRIEGQEDQIIHLDFSQDVTSLQGGITSSLVVARQDGYGIGSLTGTSFDETGTLELEYSNGQEEQGARLALVRFESTDHVRAVDANRFEVEGGRGLFAGVAGENGFGKVRSSQLEASNVDLSAEFSELVIMQRGYQASSQVVTTANEMIADLFAMKGK